jgi:hypothetical protein
MIDFRSNADALLVAVPMVAVMFAGFFRLDELFSSPPKEATEDRRFSTVDENGDTVCVEPDGKLYRAGTSRTGKRRRGKAL